MSNVADVVIIGGNTHKDKWYMQQTDDEKEKNLPRREIVV